MELDNPRSPSEIEVLTKELKPKLTHTYGFSDGEADESIKNWLIIRFEDEAKEYNIFDDEESFRERERALNLLSVVSVLLRYPTLVLDLNKFG